MVSTKAWQRHGCYQLGSEQYFNMPLEKALLGCYDDWNSLDHFDPTTDTRRMFAQFLSLRKTYNALQDGYNLVQFGNWTYMVEKPGSNHTATEMGLWSTSRSGIPGVQNLTGEHTDQIWLLYTNENMTRSYSFPCREASWISSPYVSGTTVRNLFAPYETYKLEDSLKSFFNDSKAPFQGCLPQIAMEPYGFKALVPEGIWVAPPPALTKFVPGHDARIRAEADSANATNVDVRFEFNVEMNCDSVTNSLSLNMSSSGKGSTPKVNRGSIRCAAVSSPDPARIPGGSISLWSWSATIEDVPDGVLTLTLDKPTVEGGNATTGVCRMLSSALLFADFTARRASTICWFGKVLLPTLWFSLRRVPTILHSSSRTGNTSSRTRPLVRIC
jgi:alpha-1,3-glucan synthase